MNQPILVVDDDAKMRTFVAETLTGHGYSVIAAESDLAAVTAVAQQKPCLIILDVAVPVMADSHFLQIYNGLPEPRAPVIAMVSSDQTFERAVLRCVTGCLDRPFDADELLQAVKKYLPWHRRLAA